MAEALCDLTDIETKLKEHIVIHSCVRVASFPFMKAMVDFDFTFQPSVNKAQMPGFQRLKFLDEKENIMFIGYPVAGKTHLSVAIGIEAAKNRKSTYFINCNDLMMNLKKARAENRFERFLKFYSRYKLLIIHEVGFLSMVPESSKIFFQLISRRYEKNSTIIIANIELSKWGEIFDDPVVTNTILDRLLHHSGIAIIVGDSYRLKDKFASVQYQPVAYKCGGLYTSLSG